jgi:hypothetical protein
MNFSTPWFKNSWLKSLGLRCLVLKLGVEKSGFEISLNPIGHKEDYFYLLVACKNCPHFALKMIIFSFFQSLCQKELNESKLDPPHDSINDLLGLNICFGFSGGSIFQFLLEGFFGRLAGVRLTGQFAGSLETVVSTGFGSLKSSNKF